MIFAYFDISLSTADVCTSAFWKTAADQKSKKYYFESTTSLYTFG